MDMMWYRRRGLMVTPHIERVTGAIASFNSDYNKIPVKSLICNIEPIQEGSGDPSPENVRPISGRTGLSVVRSGKNLLDITARDRVTKGITYTVNSDGTITASGTATRDATLDIGHVLLPPGIYKANGCPEGGTSTTYRVRLGNGTYSGPLIGTNYGTDFTFTLTELTDVYLRAYVQPKAGEVNLLFKPIISLDGGDYEPYKGSTYSVNWTTEVGAVYGGTLDVVNGKLYVNMAKQVFDGSENWYSYPSFSGYYAYLTLMKQGTRQDGRCNMLKTSTSTAPSQTNAIWFGVSTKYIYAIGVYNSMGSTVEDFKTYLSVHNLEVVYPLATPTEIQLTPQEIKTLLKINNIWCDSGNVTVDYWKWGN